MTALSTPIRDRLSSVPAGHPPAATELTCDNETLIAQIITQAGDRGSLSDELHYAARTAGERDQLDRARANGLRALDLSERAAVLELGAECGALTRQLGERTALVDALEPDAARARIAAQRVRNLGTVRVFAADVAELPPEPAYDLAVAGGAGAAALRPAQLASVRTVLHRGGVLCLLVRNGLGAATVTGDEAAPDSSVRYFRRMLAESGFTHVEALACLPDHRRPTVVCTEELGSAHPRLAVELPRLPAEHNERWARYAAAGMGTQLAPGLLLLASDGPPHTRLWPAARLASYFNTERAGRWCTRADVERTATGTTVARHPLARTQESGPVSVRPWSDAVLDAPTLVSMLLAQPERTEELLETWRRLVHYRAGDVGGRVWDLVPHNVLVTDNGALHLIDLEWCRDGTTADEAVDRGVLLLADQLAAAGWSGAGEGNTVRDLARWLGVLLGRAPDTAAGAAEREAWFQAVRRCGVTDDAGVAGHLDQMRAAWRVRFAEPVQQRAASTATPATFTGREIDDVVASALRRARTDIAEADRMYRGDRRHYFASAASALRACLRALHTAGAGVPRTVLDFGCGHGRVLRALRAAFDDAELIACDTDADAVAYCAGAFDAYPLPGYASFDSVPQVTGVDLIWAGSVLTHVNRGGWAALLRYISRALAPSGVAVLTTHGRRAAWLMAAGLGDYGLDEQRTRALLDDYHATGWGYVDYPHQPGYGVSLSSPAWVGAHALTEPALRMAGYTEAGWDGHQDVLVLVGDARQTLEATP